MKTKILLSLLLLSTSLLFAQEMSEKKEKIRAYKVAYITEKLSLTAEEAQNFWPIYNTYDKKQFEFRHNKMKTVLDVFKSESFENLSEKEANNIIKKMELYEDEIYAVKKQYLKDLMRVLPAKKIILLKKTEDEFNRKLLKQYKGKK